MSARMIGPRLSLRPSPRTQTQTQPRPRPRSRAIAALGLCTLSTLVVGSAAAAPARAVVGGDNASDGSYPFMVSLRENGYPYCGGTLVAAQWVLTAAHCASGRTAAKLTATVNQVRISGTGGEVRGVDRIVVDPSYDAATENFDAALLHLAARTTGIAPAPLIRAGDKVSGAAGVLATVIGYGSVDPQPVQGGGLIDYPAALQQATISIVSDRQCASVFNGREEPAVRTDLMLCAGGDGKRDACVGDSGGPLLVPGSTPGSWTDVAITSWGAGCAVAAVPGVYTRLADPQIATFVSSTIAGN
jgi:trypsin